MLKYFNFGESTGKSNWKMIDYYICFYFLMIIEKNIEEKVQILAITFVFNLDLTIFKINKSDKKVLKCFYACLKKQKSI